MNIVACLLTVLILTGPLMAQEPAEDSSFLEFLKGDNADPTTPAKDAGTSAPTDPGAMLAKWKRHEKTETDKLNAEFTAARKVAVEMLAKKALSATTTARDAAMREVDRIKELPADSPLSYISGNEVARFTTLMGVWRCKENGWSPEFMSNGIISEREDRQFQWHWIDPAAGVLGSGKDWAHLFWMEKPGIMRGINKKWYRFTMEKKAAVTNVPAVDPVIVKLHSNESAQRSALSVELEKQRKRVVTWVMEKAKQTPTSDVSDLLQQLRQMDVEADQKSGYASTLAGIWHWDRTDMLFRPHGVLATKEGRQVGRWSWVDEEMGRFAVVLNGGKTAGDIYLTDAPEDPKQLIFEAHRIVGGHIPVTRVLP
jgi:hypothetical protein